MAYTLCHCIRLAEVDSLLVARDKRVPEPEEVVGNPIGDLLLVCPANRGVASNDSELGKPLEILVHVRPLNTGCIRDLVRTRAS